MSQPNAACRIRRRGTVRGERRQDEPGQDETGKDKTRPVPIDFHSHVAACRHAPVAFDFGALYVRMILRSCTHVCVCVCVCVCVRARSVATKQNLHYPYVALDTAACICLCAAAAWCERVRACDGAAGMVWCGVAWIGMVWSRVTYNVLQ